MITNNSGGLGHSVGQSLQLLSFYFLKVGKNPQKVGCSKACVLWQGRGAQILLHVFYDRE